MIRVQRVVRALYMSLVALAIAILAPCPAHAALSFTISNDAWPAGWRDAATASMQSIVNLYNAYGDFGNNNIYVYYNAGIPTAQSDYQGSIGDGGTYPNQRVLQHETNHYLGSGTTSNWTNRFNNGLWTGSKANAIMAQFDGDGAVVHQSGVHFYPYGLNYDTEVTDASILPRNIAVMYAMRQDMGLGNASDPWSATTVTMTHSDALGTSAFNWQGNWSDTYFAHRNADYSTGNFTIRTPLDTYTPGGATPSFTFAGESLTINNTNGINGGLLFKGVGTSGVLNFKNLILDGGYVRHASSAGDLFQLNGKVTLTGSPTIDAAQGPIKIQASIGGAGSLTKTGSFITTLNGINTYGGSTTISAGTLQLAPLSPVASYTFDSVTGGTVNNTGSGGTSMNGTLAGGAAIVAGGRFGNAVSLSGGASVNINSPITALGSAGNWSVSAWVKTTTSGGSIFTKSDGSGWSNGNTILYLGDGNGGGSGGIPSGVRWGGGFFQGSTGATSVVDNAWHQVTYVNTNGAYAIYIDGNSQPLTVGNSGFTAADIGSVVRLGISTDAVAADGALNFNGLLDSVQFYNQALTSAQISNLYQNNSSPGLLPTTTNVTIAGGATLDVNGATQQIGSLTGPAGSAVTLGSGRLTVSSSSNTQFSGTISGNGGSLVKQGAGVLTLAGTTSYNGGTSVSGGTLRVNSSMAGAVNVNSGGTLQGSGTIGGLVTVASGGILAPGSSPGALTVGSLTLNAGSQTQIELGGTSRGSGYDAVLTNGSMTLGGALSVSLINSFSPVLGNNFDILDWTTKTGTFNSVSLPSLSSGLAWNLTQLYNTGALSVIDANFLPGDVNRDGGVNSADLPAMLHALTDLHDYQSSHGPGGGVLSDPQLVQHLDLTGDGVVTNADIQGLIDYLNSGLGSGSVSTVPEPASLGLAAIAGAFAICLRARRRRLSPN